MLSEVDCLPVDGHLFCMIYLVQYSVGVCTFVLCVLPFTFEQ